MLDLFSGLGGASEAMLQNNWEIQRIEINPELALVPCTKIMDVYKLGEYLDRNLTVGYVDTLDLIWASPPCTDFSTGYSSPRSQAERLEKDDFTNSRGKYNPKKAIDMVIETKRIIDLLCPKYWIIENVRGSIKYLTPILGEPTLIIDSIVLWGRFPTWTMPPNYKHIKDDAWSTNPLRANIRAKIPYEVSEACRQSIENTKTLDYWF